MLTCFFLFDFLRVFIGYINFYELYLECGYVVVTPVEPLIMILIELIACVYCLGYASSFIINEASKLRRATKNE